MITTPSKSFSIIVYKKPGVNEHCPIENETIIRYLLTSTVINETDSLNHTLQSSGCTHRPKNLIANHMISEKYLADSDSD